MRAASLIVGLAVTGFFNFASYASVLYGNSGNTILAFDSTTPGVIIEGASVTGLPTGYQQYLFGLDFRRPDGALFGVGGDGAVYSIDRRILAATKIADCPTDSVTDSPSIVVDKTSTTRLFILTSSGRIFSVDTSSGAVTGPVKLTYAPGDVDSGQLLRIDGVLMAPSPLNGRQTLYGYNPSRKTLVRIGVDAAGAMGGSVFTVGSVTSLAVTSGSMNQDTFGFTYIVLGNGSQSSLYSLNLSTGAATFISAMAANTAAWSLFSPPYVLSIIPVTARVEGANDTHFRSSLNIANGTGLPVRAEYEYFASGQNLPAATAGGFIDLAENAQRTVDDFQKDFLALDGGSGAIRITAPAGVSASANIYNDLRSSGKGTFGQYTEGLPAGKLSGVIPRMTHRPAASATATRVNIGWFNPTSTTVNVTFVARTRGGAKFAEVARTISSHEQAQLSITSLFPTLPSEFDNYSVTFRADRPLLVYAGVVDNVSGDGIFINAVQD